MGQSHHTRALWLVPNTMARSNGLARRRTKIGS